MIWEKTLAHNTDHSIIYSFNMFIYLSWLLWVQKRQIFVVTVAPSCSVKS